jgi:hypothetical protein
MHKWFKRLRSWISVLVVFGVIIGVLVLSCIVCREEKTPEAIKEGWKKAPTEKTTGPPMTWLPGHKKKKADVILENWPRGTRMVEIQPREETTYIAIPPSGEIQTPKGTEGVTVYEKPKRDWGLKFRPFIGAGVGTGGPGAVAGVDLVKLWRVHVGAGILYDGDAAGVGAVGLNVWRNIDAKGYVGVNVDGKRVFGGGVTIAIE